MKIACTYRAADGADNKSWIDEMVKDGFSYMEIATSRLPEDEREQDEIVEYALSRGFTLNLHAPFGINNITSTDPERCASSIANVKKAIDLAARHGLGTVTFHPGRLCGDDETPEENMVRMMEIISDIARYAKERKVYLGLENMELRPFELVYTVEDLNRFAPLAEDNPYFGVTMDFTHYCSHGIGMPDLSALKLPLYDVHLSQNVEGKMHCDLTAEDGLLDIREVCRLLSEYGYDGLVVLEVLGDPWESRNVLERVLTTL
ncbi:MAG: sugar phosphate isomerase/epimerase [Oscillospiraceae bacterium]|nr:sugar phosphate isomerase/epimerase [Oscillospiraceae bacterium]